MRLCCKVRPRASGKRLDWGPGATRRPYDFGLNDIYLFRPFILQDGYTIYTSRYRFLFWQRACGARLRLCVVFS